MDFFTCDFTVTKIALACKVFAGTGAKTHLDRPCHGLAFHLGGEKIYRFSDGKSLTVYENDVIFLPQGSSYVVEEKKIGDCYAVNFELSERENFPPFTLRIKNAQPLLSSFKCAEQAFTRKKVDWSATAKSALYAIIAQIQSEKHLRYVTSNAKKILSPAIEYIHNFYVDGEIKIQTLASLCSISQAYFRKLFYRCYARTPVQYINALKLDRAKELLAQTEFSIERVAEESGFRNVYYFYRFFKKAVGKTPTEYKQQT